MFNVKVLMNHTGSQAIDIINLLHKENIEVLYLGNEKENDIKNIADEFLVERSDFNNIKDYVDYLIEICKEKNIDVFIPLRKMEELSTYKKDFNDNNIKVLIPNDIELFKTLNNKAKTYELFKTNFQELIPEYYIVNDYKDFVNACKTIHDKGKEVCIKYVSDIASNSFRIINYKRHSLSELDVKTNEEKSRLSHMIDYNDLENAIFFEPLKKDLMVMEYIKGYEISCDCIKTKEKNIIIPRIKTGGKEQLITKNKEIMNYCEKILNLINYDTPCNIQFKLSNEKLFLLEINTRMSGGIIIAYKATKINIPAIAVNQILNNPFEINDDWKDKTIILKNEYQIKEEPE